MQGRGVEGLHSSSNASAEVGLEHGYRVTCADTATHFPSRRAQTSVRALHTVADRLLSVTCTLLEQQKLFDPSYEVRDAAGA